MDQVSSTGLTKIRPSPTSLVLAYGLDLRIGEPVDVRGKECLLDILEVRLPDDCFNLFHKDFGLMKKGRPNRTDHCYIKTLNCFRSKNVTDRRSNTEPGPTAAGPAADSAADYSLPETYYIITTN